MTDPDLRTLRDDDDLLDRLGHGEPADGDDVAAMLAGWRRSLPVAGRPDDELIAAVTRRTARPRRRLARATLGVAASVALVGGGVTVAAAQAGPDSPLWPVTRLVYGDLAESRAALDDATRAVSDARTAAGQGRYPDALRLLATAAALADKVDEPAAERRLRHDIAAVRGMLPAGARSGTPDATESLGVPTPSLAPDGEIGSGEDSGENGSEDGGDGHGQANGEGNGAGNGAANGSGSGSDSGQNAKPPGKSEKPDKPTKVKKSQQRATQATSAPPTGE